MLAKPLAKPSKYADKMASLPRVAVFTTGTQRGKSYTERDLQDIAANFKKFSTGDAPLIRVPAVLGHEENQEYLERSDLPAGAWAKNCYVENARGKDGITRPTLFVDFGDVPPKVARLLSGKAYRTVSAEIYDEPPEGVHGVGKMLRRVAFLGGDIPQVKNLEDIPDPVDAHHERRVRYPVLLRFREARSSPKSKTYWCFSEVQPMDRAAMIQALVAKGFDQALITDAVPDPFLAAVLQTLDGAKPMADDQKVNATTVIPKEPDADDKGKKLAEGADAPPPPPTDEESAKKFLAYAASKAKAFGCKMDDPPTPTPQVQYADKVIKLSEVNEMVTKAVADALRTGAGQDIAALKKFREETIADAKKDGVAVFCETQLKAGKLTVAQLDRGDPSNVFDELLRTDATTIVRKFTENGKAIEATAFDLRKRQIERGPVVAKYGERFKTGPDGKTVVSNDAPDEEVRKVEAHFERFSENFPRSMTKEDLVKGFVAMRKHKPGTTAEDFVKV